MCKYGRACPGCQRVPCVCDPAEKLVMSSAAELGRQASPWVRNKTTLGLQPCLLWLEDTSLRDDSCFLIHSTTIAARDDAS